MNDADERTPGRRVLVVKTSSLGDVVHLLPALTDARRNEPGLRFDWVVESAFAPVARLHPAVDRVIDVSVRAWRRHPLQTLRSPDWARFRHAIRLERYARVIDAQGLVKSAWLARMADGPRAGFDVGSAREWPAGHGLDVPVSVSRNLHAVERLRVLCATALGHPLPRSTADYGIARGAEGIARGAEGIAKGTDGPVWLLHGTTWPDKHWPERHWRELARRLDRTGRDAILVHGNDAERARAERIAAGLERVSVLPRLHLDAIVPALRAAGAFVGVDSGLAHLATALGVPGVALYGPTSAVRTGCHAGAVDNVSATLACAPCGRRVCSRDAAAPVQRDGDRLRALEPACLGGIGPDAVLARLDAVIAAAARSPSMGTEG